MTFESALQSSVHAESVLSRFSIPRPVNAQDTSVLLASTQHACSRRRLLRGFRLKVGSVCRAHASMQAGVISFVPGADRRAVQPVRVGRHVAEAAVPHQQHPGLRGHALQLGRGRQVRAAHHRRGHGLHGMRQQGPVLRTQLSMGLGWEVSKESCTQFCASCCLLWQILFRPAAAATGPCGHYVIIHVFALFI